MHTTDLNSFFSFSLRLYTTVINFFLSFALRDYQYEINSLLEQTTNKRNTQTTDIKLTKFNITTKVHHLFELEAPPDCFFDAFFVFLTDDVPLLPSFDDCTRGRLEDVFEEEPLAGDEPPLAPRPQDDGENILTSTALQCTR